MVASKTKSLVCDVTASAAVSAKSLTIAVNKGRWFSPTNGINNAAGQDV